MKKILIYLLLVVNTSFATTYNKVTTNDSHFNGTAFGGATVVGGDTILYEVGTHDGNQYFNGYDGNSETDPIVIDLNGQVIDALTATYGIRLVGCSHVRIVNGTLHNASQSGVYTVESTGIVIENVTVYNTVSTGIRIGLQSVSGTPSTWRANTSDPYAKVINCTVSGSGDEGIYVGPSNTHNVYFDGSGNPYELAFVLYGEVSGCTVYDTDLDGIQMGGVSIWGTIHDNLVYDYALIGTVTHDNGIQFGTGSHGAVYNNIVHDTGATTGSMYQIQGDGVLMYNNLGYNGATGVNILSSYTSANRYTWVYNNTFVDISLNGIYINSSHLRNMKVYNNIFHLVAAPSAPTNYYIREIGTPDYAQDNNIFTNSAGGLTALDFTNYAGDDFTLGGSSSALTGGTGAAKFNIKALKRNLADSRRDFNNIGTY